MDSIKKVIRAEKIIDGISDKPLFNGVIGIINDKISYIGESSDLSSDFKGNIPNITKKVIMPGMINCHGHLHNYPYSYLSHFLPLQ